MKIFLIGYMGSGKTSIGRELARRIGFRFTDMDKQIERESGKTVSQIFADHGEDKFRRLERGTLERVSAEDGDTVIATGGGVPCFGDNMAVMNDAGHSIYLKMSPGKLVRRLEHGRAKRPIIRGMDDGQLLEFINKNLVIREPFYRQASLTIDCDRLGDDHIIMHIIDYIGSCSDKKQQNEIPNV